MAPRPAATNEKELVLGFGLALRDRIEKVRQISRRHDPHRRYLHSARRPGQSRPQPVGGAVRVDPCRCACRGARATPRAPRSTRCPTSASDAEAERLAEAENKADAIGGVNLTEEPTEVADILIELAQRETRTFSNRFARLLMGEMKTTVRMHKHPLKSAGFKVLKAPDVPSVLVELGYVSNKGDLEHLVSENWRNRTVGSMAQAIDAFLAKRLATAGTWRTEKGALPVPEALVWPQRPHYKNVREDVGIALNSRRGQRVILFARAKRLIAARDFAEDSAGNCGAKAETELR